jgi:hypothetical protein
VPRFAYGLQHGFLQGKTGVIESDGYFHGTPIMSLLRHGAKAP